MIKPRDVSKAILVIWVSLLASALMAVADRWLGFKSVGDMTFELLFYAVFCIVPYKLANRSNAARYFYAVIVALSVFMYLGGVSTTMGPVEKVGSLAMLPFTALSLYWLFSKPSANWYLRDDERLLDGDMDAPARSSTRKEPAMRV